jgi:hypothetical protein
MENELIERVARALHHAEASASADVTGYGDVWGWDDLMPAVRERHLGAARTAIEAMEPFIERRIEEALNRLQDDYLHDRAPS